MRDRSLALLILLSLLLKRKVWSWVLTKVLKPLFIYCAYTHCHVLITYNRSTYILDNCFINSCGVLACITSVHVCVLCITYVVDMCNIRRQGTGDRGMQHCRAYEHRRYGWEERENTAAKLTGYSHGVLSHDVPAELRSLCPHWGIGTIMHIS